MSFLEKLGKKTVREVVDTTASTVNLALKEKAEDIFRFVPIAISIYLLFRGGGKGSKSGDTYIIHNHFEGVKDAGTVC